MGIFKNLQLKASLKGEQLKLEIEQTKVLSQYFGKEAQRFVPAPDAEDSGWLLTGQGYGGDGGTSPESLVLTQINHQRMLDRAWGFYKSNLFGRAIVRNLAKFVLGKGPTLKSLSENKLIGDYWKSFCIRNRWSLREKEMVMRSFRDGEVFLRKFMDESTGDIDLRFLRAHNIKNPTSDRQVNPDEKVTFGIGTNPDDIEDVKTYYFCGMDGNLIEKIPADQVIHIKILVDSDMKRGLSIYYHAMPMITKYTDWLDDRIALNKVRSAIALIRTVDGTSGAVSNLRESQRTEHKDADKAKFKMPQRATVLTASQGISYQMISPNIHAQDVKDDGRSMLLAVAAGVGFPEMFLTADFSNANYSSSMVAQNPFVREIEDWQDFFEFFYADIFRGMVRGHKEFGDKKIPEGESEECSVEWPPLILADIEKNNKAREIQFRSKVLSRKTWQMKEGLDPDEEKRNLELEKGDDIYATPFAMPAAPVNQFGSEYEEEEEF